MKQYLEVLVGIPASGKSFYSKDKISKNPNWVRTNKDDIRRRMREARKLDIHARVNESQVIEIEDKEIIQALKHGKNVISDNTHLGGHHLDQRFPKLLEKFPDVELVVNKSFLEVPLEVCLERNSLRSEEDRVPDDVVRKMWNQGQEILRIKLDRKRSHEKWLTRFWENDNSKPSAFLCDLDGTLSILNNRSPYEDEKCEQDIPNVPVIEMITCLSVNNKIIFVSGRQDKSRTQTINWIETHTSFRVGYNCLLFMRKTGDTRKDSIVKEEIYRNEIEPYYFVVGVADDRFSVVDFWRSIGLFVFDCNQTREVF